MRDVSDHKACKMMPMIMSERFEVGERTLSLRLERK
jgi:hypothetical protein